MSHDRLTGAPCPPGLTLSALCAATAVLITVHPQMLDVMSMSQFLNMTGSLFAGVLSPDANAAHRDHLHLDMGRLDHCR